MQKCVIAALKPMLAMALSGAFFFTVDFAKSDPRPPSDFGTGAPAANCDAENVVVYGSDQVLESNVVCASDAEMLTADRDYLIATSTPGSTMVRQGPALAVGRLHPEFVRRLAAAIREARQAGLPSVGVFSAYRPPAFGVGGFSDKFNSLHSYGLAVDMSGIGGPGSAEAKIWYESAAKHGVTCPYGFENRVEWNHCQPTRIKIVLPESPLRDTVTASGPIDLVSMFEAGNSLIESPESVAEAISAGATERVSSAHADPADTRLGEQAAENGDNVARRRFGKVNVLARAARARSSSEQACARPLHPRKEVCGASRQAETAARTQGPHPRQASANVPRHRTGVTRRATATSAAA
jgi:hypothetical protein